MCDPVTGIMLASAAASAGGSVVSGREQASSNAAMINARNKATEAELARQKQFQAESGGIFDTSLGAFSPEEQAARLTGGQQGARTFFDATAPSAADIGTITTGAASPLTASGEARSVADAIAAAAARSGALGDLTGWDTANFDNRVGLADSARQLGTISNLSANSARVGGLEGQVNANNAYRPPSGLGDLLSFAGRMGSAAAGSGMFAPAQGLPAVGMGRLY